MRTRPRAGAQDCNNRGSELPAGAPRSPHIRQNPPRRRGKRIAPLVSAFSGGYRSDTRTRAICQCGPIVYCRAVVSGGPDPWRAGRCPMQTETRWSHTSTPHTAPLKNTGQIRLYGPEGLRGNAPRRAADGPLSRRARRPASGRVPRRRKSTISSSKFGEEPMTRCLPRSTIAAFRKSICTSVNHVVCHGIPATRR
jgi:hypothetical protein